MKKYIVILIALVLLASIGFYFKDYILKSTKNLQPLNQLGDVVNEVKKQIFTPGPLNIGGAQNNVVLVKAKIIAQTNVQRYDNGTLPPLLENAKLDAAAKAKADDMFAKQYFEHVSPSGVNPGSLVKSFGYDYVLEGENLILGNFKSEAEIVNDWMNSPGHRANILNSRFTEIGVAIVKGTYQGQTVWISVQEFGLPLSACSAPSVNLKNQIDANKTNIDQLSAQIDAKKAEIDNTNSHSSEYNAKVDEYNQLVAQYNALAQETKALIAEYNSQINVFNQCVSGT